MLNVLACSTTNEDITHIIHFADIHIRNGDMDRSRYQEYKTVMKNCLVKMDSMDSVKQGSALTLIAGDVFHHKGRMDTPALQLFFWWMDELLSRTPVLMICGNHDFRQEDPRHPDVLETVNLAYTHRKTRHPLYYLKDTGHYRYGSVGMGLVSVKDTLKSGSTSGINKSLPSFPDPHEFDSDGNIKHRVALFHGTISQNGHPSDARSTDMQGYPLQWFKGYDCVLLGDIHKQQVHYETEFFWGYPGSLVQQDYGEAVFGHGFLVWDLTPKVHGHCCQVHAEHVENPFGMITVKWSERENGYAAMLGRRDTIPLCKIATRSGFPSTPKVRILGQSHDEEKVVGLLQEYGVKPSFTFCTTSTALCADDTDETAADVHQKMIHLSDFNAPSHWVEFLGVTAPEVDAAAWILRPENMKLACDEVDSAKQFLPDDLTHKIQDRNTRIQKAIDDYYTELHSQKHQTHITLKHMSWDYAMCYGQGNYFEFASIDDTVALLNGCNASGKSSFLDVLCIGLYGEPTKHRNMLSGRKMTAKMIHDQRPSHRSLMRVSIMFKMDEQLYEITRAFTTQKKEEHGTYAQLHLAQICKIEEDMSSKAVLCEGSVAVENWVARHFGSIEDMLMSTIVCQTDLTNFFYLKQDDQKKILDHALQLGSITAFGKVLKEAILAHNEWVSLLRTSLQAIESVSLTGWVTPDDIATESSKLQALQQEEAALEKEGNALLGRIGRTDDLPSVESAKQLQKLRNKAVQSLSKYEDIADSDMELCLMVKGEHMSRFESLKRDISNVAAELGGEEPTLDIATCTASIEDVEHQIEDHKALKIVPQISEPRLASMKDDISKWAKKYPSHWSECPDDLEQHMAVLKTRLNELRLTEREHLLKAIEKPTGKPIKACATDLIPPDFDARAAKLRLAHIQNEIHETRLSIEQPVRPQEGYFDWKKEWERWLHDTIGADGQSDTAAVLADKVRDYASFMEQRKQRITKRASLENDIKQMEAELCELKDIPFNPECWACKQQPCVLRQQQLDKRQQKTKKLLSKILQYLQQCDQHGSVTEMQEVLISLEAQLEKRRYYEKFADKMTVEFDAWKRARAQWKQKDEKEAAISKLAQEASTLEEQVNRHAWNAWQNWSSTMETILKEKQRVEHEVAQIGNFWLEYDSRVQELYVIEEEGDKWEAFRAWEAKLDALNASMERLLLIKKYWKLYQEYGDLESQLRLHGDNIERIYAKKGLLDRLQTYDRVACQFEWDALSEKLSLVRKQKQESHKRLVLLQNTLDEQRHLADKRDWMMAHIDAWGSRKARLQSLESKFIGDSKHNGDGYKEWIYRERVVPLVTEEVNMFLSTIESIRLRMVYDKKCFIYYLEDRGNTPTLDKASGYQNFVVGLAMRLALARIGAVGQNVRHIFIDEGFTACDVGNIEKVPVLLRGIMRYGGYKSIVLMSHLEPVQEAAGVRIDIERKGMFSFIKWGGLYPSAVPLLKTQDANTTEEGAATTSATAKKRGRPRKNAAGV